MKVLFVSQLAEKGGAEAALLELLDGLSKRGVDCRVLFPQGGGFLEEIKARKIPCSTLPYQWWMRKPGPAWRRIAVTLQNLAAALVAAIKIRQWGCDAVYTNSLTVCIGALGARLARRPHIWHFHEFGYQDHGFMFDLGQKISLSLVNKCSDACIANSKAVAEKFAMYLPSRKLSVVYCATTLPDCDFPEEEYPKEIRRGIHCVIVGTLHDGKRQEDAVLAIGDLRKRGTDATLTIIGEGSAEYRRYLIDLIAKLNLEAAIELTGYLKNPFLHMRRADVILVCSKQEAFGRVTVEAMKLGKPVIGSRSGGTPELIRDGFNGFLYEPLNHHELAEKISYLFRHPDLARQMGKNGLEWANQQFTEGNHSGAVLEIITKLLHSKQRNADIT